MIEHLTSTETLIQHRSAATEGVKGNPVNVVEQIAPSNQSDKNQTVYFDEKKKEKLEEVVSGLNHFLEPAHTSIRFKMHEKLNKYYVVIVNDNTNEVVKEIPPKKLLDVYAAMAEHLGLLVDRKI